MWWKPKSFDEVLAPISWLNWLMGLGVFEIPLNHCQPAFTVTYCSIIGVGYFSVFFSTISYAKSSLNTSAKLVFIPAMSVNVLVATACVINGWKKTNLLQQVKHKFGLLDRTLLKLGMENVYGQASMNVIFYLIAWIIVMTVLSITDYIWNDVEFKGMYSLFITIVTMIPIAQNFVVDFTFCVLVRGIYRRLKVMNELVAETIQYLSAERYDDFDHTIRIRRITVATGGHSRTNFIKHYIGAVKQVHLDIVRLSRLVNKAYSSMLLFELTVSFTIVTASLYTLYLGLGKLEVADTVELMQVAAIATWAFVVSLKVIGTNYACSSFNREVHVTSQILRDFNRVQEDNDVREQIQQFCMQLILRPIYFTAADFVRLDNDCTRMFFSTVATYLVILMQVGGDPETVEALLPPAI